MEGEREDSEASGPEGRERLACWLLEWRGAAKARESFFLFPRVPHLLDPPSPEKEEEKEEEKGKGKTGKARMQRKKEERGSERGEEREGREGQEKMSCW